MRYLIAVLLLTGCALIHETSEEYSNLVNIIMNAVKRDYATRISLSTYAEEYKVTPQYISMLFTKETGMTFSAYVRKIRMEIRDGQRDEDLFFQSDDMDCQKQTVRKHSLTEDHATFIRLSTTITPAAGRQKKNVRNGQS